ncbi:MAG: NrfD/PsrC family molybdoenzyme membrane anchor subunit [bacterium]
MFDKIIYGSRKYYAWVIFLLLVMGVGFVLYLYQLQVGLGVTGMSRDVSWGFYIAQFTFLVGVAASGLMVVLPYYLHDYKAFGKITILGEFLAVGSVIMCMTFIFVDMGKPERVMNVILHPTPNSIMFWDMLVLSVYLLLNLVIAFPIMAAEKKGLPPPYWYLKPVIYLSIAWAPLIHTVTAFLYAGLPGRHLWLTAIMAARFLASAFAAGPALLIILYLIMTRVTNWTAGDKPLRKIAEIVVYAMIANMFFLALEFFTAFYSNIPGHEHSLAYLFFGLHGETNWLMPFMWASVIIGLGSIILMLFPQVRRNNALLVLGCIGIFVACWIDKGLGLIVGGFIPNPLNYVRGYTPTLVELGISAAVFALGALIITVLYKMVAGVREEAEA